MTICILTGIGRSGTSLLQSILYHQPGFDVYPECQFFRRLLIANKADDRPLEKLELQRVFIRENPRLANLLARLDFSAIPEGRYDLNDVLRLAHSGDKVLLLKDARDIDYIQKIRASVGDDVRAICTIRDVRDVVLSRMKADFSKRWGLLLNLAIMRFQYLSLLKAERGAPVHLARYEDFVSGDFAALSELGVGAVTSTKESAREAAEALFSAEELAKHKAKNLQPVDSANVGKWSGALSPTRLVLVDILFLDYFQRFGYQLVNDGTWVRVLNRLMHGLFRLWHPVYIRISMLRDRRRYKL